MFSTHRLIENFWSDGWNEDRVHSSQFHIDLGLTTLNHAEALVGMVKSDKSVSIYLKTQVGESLG